MENPTESCSLCGVVDPNHSVVCPTQINPEILTERERYRFLDGYKRGLKGKPRPSSGRNNFNSLAVAGWKLGKQESSKTKARI
jgi:hypothetical protein